MSSGGTYPLIRDNPRYGRTAAERTDRVPREWLREWPRGVVVATINVHDRDLLRLWGRDPAPTKARQ